MATHLKEITCGKKTYYISHVGETIYYSTFGKGKGTTSIKGLKFKKNEIVDSDTNEKVTEFEICEKLSK